MHAPFDFTNEETMELVDQKIKEYPQLLPSLEPSEDPKIKKLMSEHRLIAMPGLPQTNEEPNDPGWLMWGIPVIRNIDWEAWLVYYELCRLIGIYVDNKIIAKKTGRSEQVVKNHFKKIRPEFG